MNNRKKPTAVIVIDDPIQLSLTTSILDKVGWDVISCEGAEIGLKIMQELGAPDVIVTDLHLHGIGGWRFCRLLRSPEYPELNKVPILVMSDIYSGEDSNLLTIDLGANAFLEVPFNATTLKKHMQTLLRKESPISKKKILIIENDLELAKDLERSFESYGFIVYIAKNLKEGRSLLIKYNPHITIVNYNLPDGKGDIILGEIKTPESRGIAILTADDPSPDLPMHFIKKGADAYVRKPFSSEYLIDLCNKAIRERALLRVEDLLEERVQKLKRSEDKFRILFESSKDAIYFSSKDGSILDVNQSALNLFGYNRDEMLALNSRDLYVNPDDRQRFLKDIEERKAVVDYEEKLRKKDNSEIDCLVSSSVRYNEDGSILGYQGIIRDITGRKKMEKELLKMEKLESISVLAGGIAHDFNNILTAILGNLSLAKFMLDRNSDVYAKLNEAEKASLRAKGLTQQLLTFSKGGTPIKKIVSIKELLMDSSKFAPIDPAVTCNLSISDDLWAVEIDISQMSQVINNLIINADQAMPSGGIIDIRASNVIFDADMRLSMRPGKYVKITIIDQGIGISKENLDKIFDPYYTTKQKGSGFGLASAYSVVKNHNGYITVDSTLGVGTTFDIYLPSVAKTVSNKKRFFDKPDEATGRILIMDDEEIIRDIAESMLSYIGYTVERAKDGDEAIELYKKAIEQHKPFDAVIMDLTIPGGMGGKEAVKKILEIDPEVKAIVSSGYSNDPIMSNYEDYGFKGVISKPYKIEELSEVLKQLIIENR
jgi:PAS domain S-box-containing protein